MKITIEVVGCIVAVTIDDGAEHGAAAPNAVETQILKETKKMTGEVQRLRDDVANFTTVEQSATALIAGLAQQIRDNASDPAALSAIADQLEATQADLAAAVTANTATQAGDPPPPSDAGDGTGTTTSGDGSGSASGGADTGTTTNDAGATGGDGADSGTTAAPAGSTDASGPSAADSTVDAGAGNDATAAQQDTTGTSGS